MDIYLYVFSLYLFISLHVVACNDRILLISCIIWICIGEVLKTICIPLNILNRHAFEAMLFQ